MIFKGLKEQKAFARHSRWALYETMLNNYTLPDPDVKFTLPSKLVRLDAPILNISVTKILDNKDSIDRIQGDVYSNILRVGFICCESKRPRCRMLSDINEEIAICHYLRDKKLEEYIPSAKFRQLGDGLCISGIFDLYHIKSNTPIEIKSPISLALRPKNRDLIQVELYMYIVGASRGELIKHYNGSYKFIDVRSRRKGEKIIDQLVMLTFCNEFSCL